MPRFVELVEADPKGERRFMKAAVPGRSLAVVKSPTSRGMRPMIGIYENGMFQRTLARREIQALLVDVDEDWFVSNQ